MGSQDSYNTVSEFEKTLAEFYGSPYAVATDCCTHAIELSLRYLDIKNVSCPKHTYLSVPFTFKKLGLEWKFTSEEWNDYYYIGDTNIVDAAVFWKQNGYIKNTLMCLSFQFKKHLSIGRAGAILTDNYESYVGLKKLAHDGRFGNLPWAKQDISSMGYHYYLTPELAKIGLDKFNAAVNKTPTPWSWQDYPDLSTFSVFNEKL